MPCGALKVPRSSAEKEYSILHAFSKNYSPTMTRGPNQHEEAITGTTVRRREELSATATDCPQKPIVNVHALGPCLLQIFAARPG